MKIMLCELGSYELNEGWSWQLDKQLLQLRKESLKKYACKSHNWKEILDWKSLHTFRVIEKDFKFLYNIVEPEKQVFCMSFLSAHRPNFFNLFSYKSEKAKNTSRVSRKTTCTWGWRV